MRKDDDRPGMFEPLSEQEHERASKGSKSCVEDIHEPIVPAPGDAPEPNWERLTPKSIRDAGGTFTKSWTYHTAEGGIAFHAGRWDLPGRGKGFRPATWCGGRWQLKAMPGSRPLYNLPAIAGEPDKPIVVVEGEKCADTATGVFPDCAATTWAGGSNSWELTDWQPLAGRDVLLVSDADETGREAIKSIAGRLADLGCVVRVCLLPGGDGKDIVDLLVDSDAAAVSLHIEEQAAAWPSAEHDESIARREQSVTETVPAVDKDVSGTASGGDWVSDLVERAKTDPGAPLEPDMLIKEKALQRNHPAKWERLLKRLKDETEVRITPLEKEVSRNTGRAGDDDLQGQPIQWPDVEPWPDEVDGAALLDELAALVQLYVAMPEGGASAVAVWALYTWCFEAFGVCPNLMVTAPERESGKTRVTELLSWMVPRPKPVSDASAAAIIRGIERDRPTLLIDEAQHFLKRRFDDPIRGVLLASFVRRFAYVERCEGEQNESRLFSTFAPRAMNGRNLVGVDDMLTSRSVVIPMTRTHRRMPNLRADRDPVDEDLRRKCARWRDDRLPALKRAEPDMSHLYGRDADVWRPMFAVADEAGGNWPELIRQAAASLASLTKAVSDGETLGVQLLGDTREVFESRGNPDEILTSGLDEALNAMTERPWPTLSNGKPMTAQRRGKLLSHYGVRVTKVRHGGRTENAYKRTSFEEAWQAWLPTPSAMEPEHQNNVAKSTAYVSPKPEHTDKDVLVADTSKPAENSECSGVPVL